MSNKSFVKTLIYQFIINIICCFRITYSVDPKVFYNLEELVCSEGYYVQKHKVETEDGYILTVYRIPNGEKHPKIPTRVSQYQRMHSGHHPDFQNCMDESLNQTSTGTPILMVHGLSAAADCWILQGPKFDLAYMLADKGYDVWFANIRGNYYARQHKTLNPNDPAFWDFSFHENGVFDMPSTIDYILGLTKREKLIYVGHSMGTTMFFVMTSARPEYNDKVQLFVGLTPVAQFLRKNFSRNRRIFFNFVVGFAKAYGNSGNQEFLPRNELATYFATILCAPDSPFQNLCYDLAFSFTGYHSKLFLRKKFPMFLSHGLNGNSVKTFHHYGQQLDAPYFQYYDYGPEENLKRYGQEIPPEYDLKKVVVPTALFYSSQDYIAGLKDTQHLMKQLPNVIEHHRFDTYNHVDFLWAYNAKDVIYKDILELIDKYKIE